MRIARSDLQRVLQAKRSDAMKMGKMLAGRQMLFMIDHHVRMSETDDSLCEAEHLFSTKLKGDRLQEFVATWDQVLSGLDKAPD